MSYSYNLKVHPLTEEDGGGYLVDVVELPGCSVVGDNLQEAVDKLNDAIETWIEGAKEIGREIPEPDYYRSEEDFSGKMTLRIPKELHKKLDTIAKDEAVSMNQLISYYLSVCVTQRRQEKLTESKLAYYETLL